MLMVILVLCVLSWFAGYSIGRKQKVTFDNLCEEYAEINWGVDHETGIGFSHYNCKVITNGWFNWADIIDPTIP